MMLQILTYIFYGVIAIIGLGSFVMAGLLIRSNTKAAAVEQSAEGTIAEQISEKFNSESNQPVPSTTFVGKQQVTRQPLTRREARSIFSFSGNDGEQGLNLNSDVGEQSNRENILDEDNR